LTSRPLNTWQSVRSEVFATVNRALRAVAEAGLLERKRKAGTRVSSTPIRKATLSIPIIRHEIENKNQRYSYELCFSKMAYPPVNVQEQMKLCEERWINIEAIPEILSVNLSVESANEWLVRNAPFSHGDISFSAVKADSDLAKKLGANINDALFAIDRVTWDNELAITSVRMIFHSDYRMHSLL